MWYLRHGNVARARDCIVRVSAPFHPNAAPTSAAPVQPEAGAALHPAAHSPAPLKLHTALQLLAPFHCGCAPASCTVLVAMALAAAARCWAPPVMRAGTPVLQTGRSVAVRALSSTAPARGIEEFFGPNMYDPKAVPAGACAALYTSVSSFRRLHLPLPSPPPPTRCVCLTRRPSMEGGRVAPEEL